MSTIVTRAGKGSALTHNEVDANFVNLNTDKIQSGNTVGSLVILSATISGGSVTGITDLAVVDGGTGASDASTARTNLGAQETLVSGTNIKTINSSSILGSGNLDVSVSDGDKGDITVSASGATWTIDSGAVTPDKLSTQSQYTGFKNRIINGAMVIDQRNAGASVTPANGGAAYIYTVDRWAAFSTQNSKYSIQQNAGSVTPPAGFTNYVGVTSLAATTVSAGDIAVLKQPIEAFNTADFNLGTANAVSFVFSFWVRSSLTGTFGGALTNSVITYTYPFTFSISAANTWEYKTVFVSGPTAGTWLTGNSAGLQVIFNLGTGSTYTGGTAGSWGANTSFAPSGTTNLIATNGATFYITGVQLEKGTQATSFDYRPYGTELALCQRYYQFLNRGLCGGADSTTEISVAGVCTVPMRASPTIALTQTTPQFTSAGTNFSGTASAITDSNINFDSYNLRISGFSGLTAGRACVARFGSGGGFLTLSSEL